MKTITINVADSNEQLESAVEIKGEGKGNANTWYTYSTDKNGVYTLDDAANLVVAAPASDMKINPANVRLVDKTTAGLRAYGNDDSVYVTVEAKADATDTGAAITKVTASYTGVQSIDLLVDTTKYDGTTDDINDKVFVVYDDENYIIAAVVIGEDNSKTDSYAYALKDAKNEYVDGDDNYYWDFEAVVDGEIKTLTVKTEYSKALVNKISKACEPGKNGLFKLTYDKDGYVVDAELMEDTAKGSPDKVYGVKDWHEAIDTDLHKVYSMSYIDSDEAFFTIAGRTLYADSNKTGGFSKTDAGLTLAKDAPVIVYQVSKKVDSNGTAIPNKNDFVYDSYANLETALKALKGEGKDFVGYVSAVLDTKGTAQYIVISDTAGVDTVIDNGSTPTNGDLTIDTMTYSATAISSTQGGFVIELSNEVAIADATEYTVTITNKDGAKLLSASGNISSNIAADAGVEIKVAYSAVLGTGSYVVNVTIGDMAASDVMLVA